jgi:hypothetical protein
MTSLEQRELLKLLTQNFEYEMKTVELQAEIFIRDYSIKHKDLQLLRMSQHRSLCDTLIYQQRRLIQGRNPQENHHLNFLVLFYR